jgi:hypothetical protein
MRQKQVRLLLSVIAAALSMASAAFAAGKITVVSAPDGGQTMAAKVDAAGTIHLAFQSPSGPHYALSTDGGKTFSKAIPIVDRASEKPGLEFTVWDMAVTLDGHVHIAMGTNAWKLKLPQKEWGYFYARLDPQAKAFTPVRNINNKPSEGFSLAADDKGNVTACWLSAKLYANVSHDGGKTFESMTEIDPEFTPCNCCTTSAAYGVDGRLAVLYRESADDNRDMFLILWDQDKQQVSRRQISTTPWKIDSCPMTYYTVAATKDGYTAVWPTKDRVYFTRLDRDGEWLNPQEVATPGSSGMRSAVVALSGKNGQILVAWKKENQLGWQLYDKQGKPSGKPGSVSSQGSGAAGIVDAQGNFLLIK